MLKISSPFIDLDNLDHTHDIDQWFLSALFSSNWPLLALALIVVVVIGVNVWRVLGADPDAPNRRLFQIMGVFGVILVSGVFGAVVQNASTTSISSHVKSFEATISVAEEAEKFAKTSVSEKYGLTIEKPFVKVIDDKNQPYPKIVDVEGEFEAVTKDGETITVTREGASYDIKILINGAEAPIEESYTKADEIMAKAKAEVEKLKSD